MIRSDSNISLVARLWLRVAGDGADGVDGVDGADGEAQATVSRAHVAEAGEFQQ